MNNKKYGITMSGTKVLGVDFIKVLDFALPNIKLIF